MALVSDEHDAGCICKGNWRQIVKECEGLIGKKYVGDGGVVHTFFGVVHGADDFYYGMSSMRGGVKLLSCVGSIESYGFRRKRNRRKMRSGGKVSEVGE